MKVLNVLLFLSISLSALDNRAHDSTRIVVDEGIEFLAIGDGSAWVWHRDDQVVGQIDLATGAAMDTAITVPIVPITGSVEADDLWIINDLRDRLIRIDLTTEEVEATVDLSPHFEEWELVGVVTGEGTVWVRGQTAVVLIDPASNAIVGEPISVGEEVLFAVIAGGELWTGSHDDGLVTRIDLQTQAIIAQFDIGFSVHGLAVGDQTAWILDEHGFAVVEVDLEANTAGTRIPIDFVAANITYAGGGVWVAPAARDSGVRLGNDTFIRIDAETRTIVESAQVGDIISPTDGYYLGVYADGQAWAVIFDEQVTLVRLPD